MKVLLDENLPQKLLRSLKHHETKTVDGLGWKSIKNGELMRLIEAQDFDVFLTGDKNFSKQQNLTGRRVALVVMSAINWRIVKDYVAVIVRAVDTAKPGTVNPVQCGVFARRKRLREH